MRKSGALPTIGELMGEGFEHRTKLSMDDLPKLLGDKMPHLPLGAVGRVRLVHALQQRFGAGYGNIPGVRDILDHFDKESKVAHIVKKNMEARDANK